MNKPVKDDIPFTGDLKKYFSEFLFPRVRASNEKNSSIGTPLEKSLNYKYVDPNNNGYIRVLTVDIDWDIPMDEYIDRIPQPNVIVTNPENGHKQIMYFFKSRIYTGRPKIMYAFQGIKNNLNKVLKGDFCFAGRLQKNPLHSAWNTIWFNNAPCPLSSLIDWSMKQESDTDSCRVHDFTSRNVTIFHSLLKYACRHNKELTYAVLNSHAEYLNSQIPVFDTIIKDPLGIVELRGIVRSVWKFMQTRYTGANKNGEGQYTDEQRKRSIEKRIAKKWRNIYLFIEYRKMKIESKTIARILGVTTKTIKNYAQAIRPTASANFVTPNPTSSSNQNPTSTNYAKQHEPECAQQNKAKPATPQPPLTRWITDTVFHRVSGSGGTEAAMMKLEWNTS